MDLSPLLKRVVWVCLALFLVVSGCRDRSGGIPSNIAPSEEEEKADWFGFVESEGSLSFPEETNIEVSVTPLEGGNNLEDPLQDEDPPQGPENPPTPGPKDSFLKGMFWSEHVAGLHPDSLSDTEFDRIMENPYYDYLFIQMSPYDLFNNSSQRAWNTMHERCARIAHSDKKLIVRLWWGNQGKHLWPYERWGVPNVALIETAQKEFFERMVDKTIDIFMRPNRCLYAVLLGGEQLNRAFDEKDPGECGSQAEKIPDFCWSREV